MKKKNPLIRFIALIFIFFSLSANATSYYVSNSGNDSNSGTSTSSPWQTLDKVNSTTFSPGDNIYFKRGDTFYGSLIVSQSGSSGNPITFGAYGTGSNPVITGFADVTSWTNLGGNIWESSSAVSTLSSCNVVVINGINAAMGRYPNTGYLTYQSSTSSSLTSSSLNASTTNWTGAQAVIKKERWIIDRCPVTSASGTTINYTNASPYNGHSNWGFFIQNDTRTLDMQNEWYYNSSNGNIYVYSGSEPVNVKIASIDTLVYAVNKSCITFDGLSFTGAHGQAFYLGNVSNFKIQNCNFLYNYNAIAGKQFGGSSSNFFIHNCTFNHTNNNAINLPSEFAGATITNNIIKNTGILPGMSGSGDGQAEGINVTGNDYLIQSNIVDSTGYVSLGFNGSDNLVDKNFINCFCLIKDDGGGIYTGNPHSGIIISDNIVLNGIGNDEGTNGTNNGKASGIYCDDNSSGMIILNNSVASMSNAGIFLHQPKDIVVRGNTTYDCRMGLFVSADNASKYTTGLEVKKNIFVGKSTGTQYSPQDQHTLVFATAHTTGDDILNFGTVDSNYYARPIDDDLTIQGTVYGVLDSYYSLASWRSYSGYDAHSNKSPKSISDVNDLKFEYNASSSSKAISLDTTIYIDVAGTSYSDTLTLAPYSSAVLIKNGVLLPATNPPDMVNGLDYKYYEATSYSSLPNFDAFTPVKIGTTDNFNISLADRGTAFSIKFSGYIDIPVNGQYTFYTTSDDGSNLYIDSVLVVNNNSIQTATEKSGVIGLQAGKHAISVGYFQQSGDSVLSVSYAGPSIVKQNIPITILYRDSFLLPAVNPSNTVNGLNYKYYEAASYSSLPSFDALTPVKTGTTDGFDISVADRSEAFSFNFTGFIDVPEDGKYIFYTTSDDGSNLYIDSVLVVDNDGLHGATEQYGIVGLKEGLHAISVGYFQQGWDSVLSVSYKSPNTMKQSIPVGFLYRVEESNPQRLINKTTILPFEEDSSNVINNKFNQDLSVKVNPNPFGNLIKVNIGNVSKNKLQLILLDNTGKEVWSKTIHNAMGSYSEIVNTSTFAKGVYFFKVIQDNRSSVIKLIKQY